MRLKNLCHMIYLQNPSLSATFKSNENQRVVNQLVTEVKGLNDNFLTQHNIGGSGSTVVLDCVYTCTS